MVELTPEAVAFSGLVVEVFRVNGLALVAGDVLAAPAGLTSSRWQVLGVVDDAPASVSIVARAMGLTRQSVQLTVNTLVREGHVELVDNPQHRTARLISITPSGRKALRKVEARHAEWAHRLGARLGAARLRATLDGLRQVREALEPDPSPSRRKTRRKERSE